MEIRDRVVVVTGGGGGIGGALSRRFAAEGAERVVVCDIDQQAAETVAAEIGGTAVRADVTVESDVAQLVGGTLEAHGRIDIYCSNAGIAFGGGPEASDQAWRQSWDVHVMAHLYAARALLPGMRARRDGYIVGTISAAGLLNHILAAPYAVTKAAGLSFFEWMAIAYHDEGIRISALCPQGVRTAMLAQEGEHNFLTAGALDPEQIAEAVVEAIHDERFLILPHPEVGEFFQRKAADYDRWLRGMRRLRARILKER
ncbi:MAG: SDR family oxidoreductase [Chloroflexi bacterium]|nr:MAG: SDR family oxidoreductase [Chloroflexota bacterium]